MITDLGYNWRATPRGSRRDPQLMMQALQESCYELAFVVYTFVDEVNELGNSN